jgi:hypothetical protein
VVGENGAGVGAGAGAGAGLRGLEVQGFRFSGVRGFRSWAVAGWWLIDFKRPLVVLFGPCADWFGLAFRNRDRSEARCQK